MNDDERRAHSIALLEATHEFPVDYPVSVIVLNIDVVLTEVRAAVEEGLAQPLGDDAYETVASRGGRYSSHRFRVPCRAPEDVLALYERLRRIKGVITVL